MYFCWGEWSRYRIHFETRIAVESPPVWSRHDDTAALTSFQRVGEVAHRAAGHHLWPSDGSHPRQRLAVIAPQPWRAARCDRRSVIFDALCLVGERRRSSANDASRPRHGVPSQHAHAHAVVMGPHRRHLLRGKYSCVDCFAVPHCLLSDGSIPARL